MTALERLNLSDNQIADLWPLAGLGLLHRLDLSGSAVVDASALGRLENLRWVWLAPETAWAPRGDGLSADAASRGEPGAGA